ncbi:MAG: hypothetical protein RLZZ241_1366 [Bacteroidota bacterium]|jgi:hypothetical protein
MLLEQQGNIVIVSQAGISAVTFLEKFNKAYLDLAPNNLIINLLELGLLEAPDILLFKAVSAAHRKKGKSFVLVSDAISYEAVPDEICLVPTIQEAFDVIEMEEIERDLGF